MRWEGSCHFTVRACAIGRIQASYEEGYGAVMDIRIDKNMLDSARRQFCLDMGMDYGVYLQNPNQKSYICKTSYAEGTCYPAAPGARRYVGGDAFFNAVICFGQLFLSVDEQIYDWAGENFGECEPEWFCKYDNLRKIDEKLKEYGRELGDTHVYFLPEEAAGKNPEQGNAAGKQETPEYAAFPFAWYEQEEILRFKENNCFGSAICFSPTQPDVLAVAAMLPHAEDKDYNQEHMAGMAGVSADGEYLWQIGINVREEYQGRGLAAGLVRSLKEEIIRRGRIPFYGTSESHTVSQTVALKAGFVPAWTAVYAAKKKS